MRRTNQRKCKDCLSLKTLNKGQGIEVNANLIEYDENGDVVNKPRKGQSAYVESIEIPAICLSAQKALGGRCKATKTKTKESGITHYITCEYYTEDIDEITTLITKEFFIPVKWNKKAVLAWSSVYCYDANKTAQQLFNLAQTMQLEYAITMRDMVTGKESPLHLTVDMVLDPKKIQHAIADARNARHTWKASLHTA